MREAKAFVPLDVTQSIERFVQVAQANGLSHERSEDGLRVQADLGEIVLSAEGPGTRLAIASEDGAQLQALRDLISERIETSGVSIRWQPEATAGRPANLSVARVVEISRPSPSYARVVLEGEDLARFAADRLHFRLLFGPEGSDWPRTDAGGVTRWDGGITAWHRPVYTTRHIEADGTGGARLTFDVFLHEGGRVTEWVGKAAAGEEIAITGPGGGKLPPLRGWLGLVGDETAVPVVARILDRLAPETRGEAVLFVPHEDDVADLPRPSGVALRWRLRGGDASPFSAVRALDIPERDRFLFFAAERTEAMVVREELQARGIERDDFHAAAYWAAA